MVCSDPRQGFGLTSVFSGYTLSPPRRVSALIRDVYLENKRADELEAVVALERAARLTSDQRVSDMLAFLQSSLGVTLPPNLMGPPASSRRSSLRCSPHYSGE